MDFILTIVLLVTLIYRVTYFNYYIIHMANWKIDPEHTSATFKVKHLGVAWVRGQVYGADGMVEFDPAKITDTKVNATLSTNTINTGLKTRDGHLLSPDFFDVENYPTISFISTGVEMLGEKTIKMFGDLTIRDKTKSIETKVEFHGTTQKQTSQGDIKDVSAFTLTAEIDRTDFGLVWNMDLPNGKVLVGNEVEIVIETEVIKE